MSTKRLYHIRPLTHFIMDLDIDSLGEILRKERASPSLQPVSETFYGELRELLKKVESDYPPYSRERENLQNLVTNIFNSREKKLVLNAVSIARAGEDEEPENATSGEREFFGALVGLLKRRRGILSGEEGITKGSSIKSSSEEKNPSKEKKSEVSSKKMSGRDFVTLRILEELPPIVGSDGKTYGSFKPDDIVALPERNSKVFVKNGYGEPIGLEL